MEKCSADLRTWFSAIEKGKLSVIQRLLKNPEDIDISTSVTIDDVEHHNVTGLILASHVGVKDVVRWFLLNKADVNATTSLGWQAIHFAAKRGHVATVDMLFSNGAIPDNVTKNHETPIYLAFQAHMWDTVRKLLQLGATLDDTNEHLFSHCVQRGLLSIEMLNKRKFSRHPQLLSKPEHEPTTQHPTLFHDVSPPLQSAPLTSIDVTSQTLVSQLQYQCFGYDLEITQRKRDLLFRLPLLPTTLHLKSPAKLVQLVKILTNTHASLPFRISAIKDAIRLLPILDCRTKLKQGKRGVISPFQGCIEPYLRLLELSICERNCSEELASLISELTGRLCVINVVHSANPPDESDSECAEQANPKGESPVVIKIIYISRLLRKLVSKASSKPCAQYRAGILTHLCRILNSEMFVFSADNVNGNCDNLPSLIPLPVFEPLLNSLFQLTDALDQATNVSRLSQFIQLIGACFSRSSSNELRAEKFKAEFADKFTDLADILVAWCVDPSSYSRGVAVGSIYRSLRSGLGPWWLNFPSLENSTYSVDGHQTVYLRTAACNMLGRLLEDTDDCLEKATTEYRHVCSSVTQRRGGPLTKPPATSDIAQNINAANIFSSVLSNTCAGLKRHLLTEKSSHARIGMPPESLCVWTSRLFNVLRNLDLLMSINAGLKPNPTPRTHMPSSYSLPLTTLPELQHNAHNLLAFTISTLECENENLPAKISQHFLNYINRATDGMVSQVSLQHVSTLCELVHVILQGASLDSTDFVVETFKVLFGPDSLLHRLKTSAVGSRPLLQLLLEIANSDLIKVSVVLEMCLNDVELFAQNPDKGELEMLLLFALTLFTKILPLGSESLVTCFIERLFETISDIFRRTTERNYPSDRVRMAIIYTVAGIPLIRLSDVSLEAVSVIIQRLLSVPSFCGDELDSIRYLLSQYADVAKSTTILVPLLSSYLYKLLLNPNSPVRANAGQTFRTLVGLLIRFLSSTVPPNFIPPLRKLALLCVGHPTLHVRGAGTDLLLILGAAECDPSLFVGSGPSSRSNSLFVQWFSTMRPEVSTPLLTSASLNATQSYRPSSNLMRSQSSFPSLPAIAGMLGFLTRGAPYVSSRQTSRLGILRNPNDWIRRLACMITPLSSRDSGFNWFASSSSAVYLVVWFTAWSMVDYKLKVAPWANPCKTFLSLEGIVHALLSKLSGNCLPKLKQVVQSTPGLEDFLDVSMAVVLKQPLNHSLLQATYVAVFLQMLEKMIANAVDGFAASLPPALASHAFFKMNMMTCHQWFNRIRGPFACLHTWIHPLSSDFESSASAIWSIYSLLHQVIEFAQPGSTQWLNQLSKFGDPEGLLLCLVLSLYRVGANEELNLLHCFLQSSTFGGKYAQNPFAWVRGLACLNAGQLDEAIASLSTFVDTAFGSAWTEQRRPLIATYPDFGLASRNFALRLLIVLLIRVGDLKRVEHFSTLLQETSSTTDIKDEVVCTNRGDSVGDTFQRPVELSSDSRVLPIYFPKADADIERLRALQMMSKWDICLTDASHPKNEPSGSRIDLLSHLENKLLLDSENQHALTSEMLKDLVNTVRQTSTSLAIQTSPSFGFGTFIESPLSDILARANILDGADDSSSQLPQHSNTVSLATWQALAGNCCDQDLRTRSVLSACENMVLRLPPTRQGTVDQPVDGSRGIAMRMLINEATTLKLMSRPIAHVPDYLSVVSSVNERTQLPSIDRLRMIRCLGNLLWLNESPEEDDPEAGHLLHKVVAMNCLAQGLRRSVVEAIPDRLKHAGHCLMNASVALQLFNFLEGLVTGYGTEYKSRTFCEAIYDCASLAVTEAPSSIPQRPNQLQSQAVSLVRHLLFFSELASAPWVDGLPLVPPGREEESNLPQITQEVFSTSSPSGLSMRLLMFATRLSPTNASAAAWLQMANWCFTRGQNGVVSLKSTAKQVLAKLLEPGGIEMIDAVAIETLSSGLLEEENERLESMLNRQLPAFTNEERMSTRIRLLSSLYSFLRPREDLLGTDVDGFAFSINRFCPDDLTLSCGLSATSLKQKFAEHLVHTVPELFPSTSSADNQCLNLCRSVVSSLTGRLYTLHTFAAQAYVTYLTVAGQVINNMSSGGNTCEQTTTATSPVIPTESIAPIEPVTATLRLLYLLNEPCRSLRNLLKNLLVHGSDSQEPLRGEVAFQSAALSSQSGPVVWASCLPHLLVRLGHPDPAVRQCLLDLLRRLIEMTSAGPAAVVALSKTDHALVTRLVFPAIVSSQGVDAAAQSDYRTKSHAEIVSALRSMGCSEMVDQVLAFVVEARRLAILWEELWCGALIQHLDELAKKTNMLAAELRPSPTPPDQLAAQTSDMGVLNSEVSRGLEPKPPAAPFNQLLVQKAENLPDVDKAVKIRKLRYRALVAPTFAVFNQLITLTLSEVPQTSHEAWFQATFKTVIDETVNALNQLCESPDPQSPAVLLQALVSRFQTLAQPAPSRFNPAMIGNVNAGLGVPCAYQPTNPRVLNLSHVSPRLANLSEGLVSVSTGNKQSSGLAIPLPGRSYLNLARVGLRINVYPTKTRPKRIIFWGENGCAYPYLLKCLEDLRLDDRVIQLMRLTNIATRSRAGGVQSTTLRTYSVTPIGPKAGLIQMVQGAMPLFSLYKRWQQRRAADALDGDPSKPLIIPKPSDLFYSRLKELMPSDALISSASRLSWPLPILRKVLTSLEAETAPDLLTRELWAASPSMSSWWKASSTFAQSLGSTSAFGYLLGLGDRHLDNLLVDLTTGRLVHIDFNICFDEGRSLRVPELVPFRLTRILRHPLGPLAFHFLSSLHAEHEAIEKPQQQQPQNLVSMGAFGQSFQLTLETFRQISELIMIQLHSFAFDPLTDWMRSRQSECNFDLSYLSAYRGGCIKVAGKTDSNSAICTDLSKGQRLRQRIFAELQRNAGLLAARFIELRESTIWKSVNNNLYDTFERLEENLVLWKQYKDTEIEAHRVGALLEELKSKSAASRLASFEQRVRLESEVSAALVHTIDRLSTFVTNLQDSVSSRRSVISRWLIPANGIFKLPASLRCERLITLITAYRSVARSYLVPPDSNLQISSDAWFNKTKFSIHVLSRILQRTDLKTTENLEEAYLSAMSELPLEQPSWKSNTILESLTSAIALTTANTETLKMQNLALDESELDLEAILVQEEDNLRLFLREQGIFGPAAFKWALAKRVSEWVKSLAGMEILHKQEPEASLLSVHRLDQIYQHLVTLTAAFSMFDSTRTEYSPPLGEFCPIPFNAGLEADAQAELVFLFSVNEFVKCLVDLRDNIFELLLPELEDALIDAPSEGGLIDQLARILLQYGEVDSTLLQGQVADLLMRSSPERNKNDEHLAQVFLALHLTLTNASAQMAEISRRMSECPITAPAWFYVDYVSQAVGILQSRCVNGFGATSLWGWRPISGEPVRDSWTDEVYISGLAAILNLCESLRCHWSTIRCGVVKTDHLDESTGQTDRIDWEQRPVRLLELFLGRLINRLALISQATLAASRLLLSLLEESGMSVRNALIEIDRLNAGSDLQHSLLATDRLVQSAEFCAMSMQPPRVRALAGVAGSLLTNLFTRTGRYVNKTTALRSVFYADEHVRRLSLYRTVFVWIHGPSFPESELKALEQEETVVHTDHGKETSCPVSLPVLIEKMNESVAAARMQATTPDWTKEETEVVEEICTLGEAICAAESERIQTQVSQTEILALLKERDSLWQKRKSCKSELTDMDFKLLALKEEYNLDWPASKWLSKTVAAACQPAKSCLLDCLSSDLYALEAKLQDSRSRLLAVSSALAAEDRQKTAPRLTDSGNGGGGTSAPAKAKNRGKGNRKASSIASNHELVSNMATVRQVLATFQRNFLLELRPYVKFALRMEQLLASDGSIQATGTAVAVTTTTKSSAIWASWLENQQVWTSTSMRLLKNFTRFVTDLGNFPESACFEEHTFNLAEELVTDCRDLRHRLTPCLLNQLKLAVLKSMSLAEEGTGEKFAECFAELDFHEEKSTNGDEEDDSTNAVGATVPVIDKVSSPDETLPPAVIAALKRLYDRLRGHDSLLFQKQSPSRTAVTTASPSLVSAPPPPLLSPSEQTEACIYAAVDPDRLAPMFEGWTAWV
uniref:Uncharacterized protein n=1 Tax=Schistocephalus solidus TaxID=70667 RepID=A0A0X3PRU1_SCHSO